VSYRGPNPARMQTQVADILRQVGQTAVWRQYASASDGVDAVGLGETRHYREQTITALFYQGYTTNVRERQTPAGLLAAGEFAASTRERLARDDELIWRGVTYRVESDPMPGRVAGLWVAVLARGD